MAQEDMLIDYDYMDLGHEATSKLWSPTYKHFKYNEKTKKWKYDYCIKAYEKRDTSTFWKHLRSKHLDKINNIPEEISELSEKISKLSFTIDTWTSANYLPFLGISAHWINNNLNLQSVVLDFCYLPGSHTGKNLTSKFLEVLSDFNLNSKYISSNKNINFNIKNQHIRCFAHIINLVARDLIKELYIKIEFDNDNDILKDKDIEKLNNIIFRYFKDATDYAEDKLNDTIKNNTEQIIKNTANAAKNKILKYYLFTDKDLYKISINPRLKLEYFKNNNFNSTYITEAKKLIFKIWNQEYKEKYPNMLQQKRNDSNNKHDNIFLHVFKQRKVDYTNKLEDYLSASIKNKNIDILLWWKLQVITYPNLTRMAQNYLAILATSAPIERIFSNATDLITPKRNNLKSKTINKLICLKSWLKLNSSKLD
ncbi:13544_t:CDS:2 [Dentiscutata heterogama]|uniref:13544_t:CDS:1 n=1 Tax=Dentiscutata heterogama TaxID=1316150 RepID=A0ACA9LAK7_9GLOM|nr:13544_t:CDS:2 [Dentiscutata heterogama]